MEEPAAKKAVAFIDGQNLYHHAKAAFGHTHPNFDPNRLFDAICRRMGWLNGGVRFYTGVPPAKNDPFWHGYWSNRLLAMRRNGIHVTSRPLRYYREEIQRDNDETTVIGVPVEKGIDVRLALDVIRLARERQYDVGLIFSQDQDLAEVVPDVRDISRAQKRWIKLVSAFPSGPNASARRGIHGTDWLRISQDEYDACLDLRDYRPNKARR